MSNDDRDVLEVLKAELSFIENGGYGRSVRTPSQPTSAFQDSPSCLNFADPERIHPCEECLLMAFVPPDQRGTEVPCHHIPLGPSGETVDELGQELSPGKKEEAMKEWLRATIHRIELERAARKSPSAKPL
jgi:hypothetical protein